MKKNIVQITAIQCPSCLDIIFSRAHHDYRRCSCRKVGIDGGREYTKVSYEDNKVPHFLNLELINLTLENLYNDWANAGKKFGIIKTKKIVYSILYRYTLNSAGKFYRYEK